MLGANGRLGQSSFFSNNQGSSFFNSGTAGTNTGTGGNSFFSQPGNAVSIFNRSNTMGTIGGTGTIGGIGGGMGGTNSIGGGMGGGIGGGMGMSGMIGGTNGQGSFATKGDLSACKGNRETIGCLSGCLIGKDTYSKLTLTEIRMEDYRIFKSGGVPDNFKPLLQRYASCYHINPDVQIPMTQSGLGSGIGTGTGLASGGLVGSGTGSNFFSSQGNNSTLNRGGIGMGNSTIGSGMNTGTIGGGLGTMGNSGMGIGTSGGFFNSNNGGGMGLGSTMGSGMGTSLGGGTTGGFFNSGGNRIGGGAGMQIGGGGMGMGMNAGTGGMGGSSFFGGGGGALGSMNTQTSFFNQNRTPGQIGQSGFFNNTGGSSFFNNNGMQMGTMGGLMPNGPMSIGTGGTGGFFNNGMNPTASKMPFFQNNNGYPMMNQLQNYQVNPMMMNQGMMMNPQVPCIYVLPISSDDLPKKEEEKKDPKPKENPIYKHFYDTERRDYNDRKPKSYGVYYPEDFQSKRPRALYGCRENSYTYKPNKNFRRTRVDLSNLSRKSSVASYTNRESEMRRPPRSEYDPRRSFVPSRSQEINENYSEFPPNQRETYENKKELQNKVQNLLSVDTSGCNFSILPRLEKMSTSQLEKVENLTMENEHGRLFFPGTTDVRGIVFRDVVRIEDRELEVYPDNSKKPPCGEGLNKNFYLTFKNVKKENDAQTDKEFIFGLKKMVAEMTKNGIFHEYDSELEEMTIEIWEI